MRYLLVLLLLLIAATAEASQCRTITLPDSNGNGGAITVQPGSNYIVNYSPPPNASSVGLEFWTHAFPGGVPEYSQYLLVYLNDPTHNARRIFHAWNSGPEYPGSYAVNFPMSTFVNPGEQFVVNWLNNTSGPVSGYFAVTIRECYG